MTSHPRMPNNYPVDEDFSTAPPPASSSLLASLANAGVDYDIDPRQRAEHSRDWWPRTIAEVARAHVESWPGVVVRPQSTDEVSATLRLANESRIAVTVQGGRSSVVGGAVPAPGAIALDLTKMSRVLEFDEVTHSVRVEAGIFGPDLEGHLRPLGFSVGHFPQSFDLATVGGWIACRGAGQYSNRYGKIEDMVRGLRVVLASGDIVSLGNRAPRQAVGPDLTQLFVGSEGTLGVITEATLLVHPLAPYERRATFKFNDFDEAMAVCRRIVQRGAHPAVLRLYDEAESKRPLENDGCALREVAGGDVSLGNAAQDPGAGECRVGTPLDVAYVEQWLTHRNDVSALTPLWERGLVVDTIEVAGFWSGLSTLRERVSAALRDQAGMFLVSVHQSHAYHDGACLYFTFAGEPAHDMTEFYRGAWDAAMREVIELGSAISHHHGIGRNRARFVADALGSSFSILEGLKAQLDPFNTLNPGVLGVGGTPW
jgi:alkyldihydroxyacetonephosphate synthase